MLNSNCNYFKKINLKSKGIFDNFVDVTYVLTLQKSNRHENMFKQLYKFKPTSNIFIFYDKGFRNCKKKLVNQNTGNDILNSHYNVLYHAKKNNYNNILVLEDDFIFNERIFNKKYIDDIENFFNYKKNELFAFSLGSISVPFLYTKEKFNTHKYIYSCAAHAIIYPKKSINKLVDKIDNLYNKNKFKDIEELVNYDIKRYIYNIPLCCQYFPNTNNKQTYNFIVTICVNLLAYFYEIDKKENIFEKYDKIYRFIKILYEFIKIIFLVLVILLLKNYYKNK